MLTCPNSKNGLKNMKHSENETLMTVLQDQVSGDRTLKGVTTSLVLSSVQVPPLVPRWLRNQKWPKFYYFLLAYFKICFSWDWSILEVDLGLPPFVSLWWEGLPVICAFWHTHCFYPFPCFVMVYSFQFNPPLSVGLLQNSVSDFQGAWALLCLQVAM
jgi:hypothetical protein